MRRFLKEEVHQRADRVFIHVVEGMFVMDQSKEEVAAKAGLRGIVLGGGDDPRIACRQQPIRPDRYEKHTTVHE